MEALAFLMLAAATSATLAAISVCHFSQADDVCPVCGKTGGEYTPVLGECYKCGGDE